MERLTDVTSLCISGWRREDGRLGIRNHVVVLPIDKTSERIAVELSAGVPGVVALRSPSAYTEGSDDPAFPWRIAVGLGRHPNSAATAVVGSDPAEVRRLVQALRPRSSVGFVAPDGDDGYLKQATDELRRLQASAASMPRETAPVTDLWVSAKCDQSDSTSAKAACPTVGAFFDSLVPRGLTAVFGETTELLGVEAEVAARGTATAAEKWRKACARRRTELAEAKRAGTEHRQPTELNIRGGLDTLEKKGMSSLAKIGTTSRFIDVLSPAEAPNEGPGLYFMDTSSEIEAIDQMAAAGFVITALPTGVPTDFGNPLVPLIQINGNAAALASANAHVDLNVAGLLDERLDLTEIARAMIDLVCQVAAGAPTVAEQTIR